MEQRQANQGQSHFGLHAKGFDRSSGSWPLIPRHPHARKLDAVRAQSGHPGH
jgi:hypothetical protein